MMNKRPKTKQQSAFTVIELLVVIVIIGILALVSIVSYQGIVNRAIIVGIQSDLMNNKDNLEMYSVIHKTYPYGLDSENCPNDPVVDNTYCLEVSKDNLITYTGNDSSYTLIITHDSNKNGRADNGELSYRIDETGNIAVVDDGTINSTFIIAWDGDSDDYGSSIVQTSDGGYAITGYQYVNGDSTNGMFITKYDANINIQWSKKWGSSGNDEGVSLIQLSDDSYIVTGVTSSYGAGGSDIFIAKYSSVGDLVWSKTWGGTSDEYPNSIIETSDGGYAITGYTYSFGGGLASDMFIAKYSSIGTLVWAKVWGGADTSDYGSSVAQTSDDGYIVTGRTESYGVGGDMFIAKYSSIGNLVWSKTWGGVESDYGVSVAQSSGGDYYVVGSTHSFGAGNSDMFIAKYSSIGNLVWSKTWGGADMDSGNSVVLSADEKILVNGTTWSYGVGGEGVYLSMFDSAGANIWTNTFNNPLIDEAKQLIKSTDGGYISTGISYINTSGANAYIAKFNNTGWVSGCPASICEFENVNSSDVPTPTIDSPTMTNNDFPLTEMSHDVTDSSVSGNTIDIWNP